MFFPFMNGLLRVWSLWGERNGKNDVQELETKALTRFKPIKSFTLLQPFELLISVEQFEQIFPSGPYALLQKRDVS
jgi:hypothetical protein